MVEPEKAWDVPAWVLRSALLLCVIASVPLYLMYLHTMGSRWNEQLPADDTTRGVLPFVVPAAAFSYTTLASLSWWVSLAEDRWYLLGPSHWRFLVVFVAALSMLAGFIGAHPHDLTAAVMAAMMTALGLTGLWLLPPALSPRLLAALPKRKQLSQTPS